MASLVMSLWQNLARGNTLFRGKWQRLSSVSSGPGQSSQSRVKQADERSSRRLPAGPGAGQLSAVHYILPGRHGAPDLHALGIF